MTTNDGTERTYLFVKQDDHHVLKTSVSEFFFKVDTWLVDGLFAITIDTFGRGGADNMDDGTEEQQ